MQQTESLKDCDASNNNPGRCRSVTFRFMLLTLLSALAATAFGAAAMAQDAETEKGLEKYRAMMREDPWSNPGYLDVDRGEALWSTARGPKSVTLEACVLGKGPGKV